MLMVETGFVELQTDKRNTYRKKVAADKAAGKVGSPPPGEEESYVEGDHEGEVQMDRDGQPVAKRARLDESGILREGDIPDMMREEEAGEEDEGGDEPEDDDEEEGDEVDERQEIEEQFEEPEHHEAEDEALDNGEDSD
jgi:DNA polymerase epsilon subunit 3